jgi:hypothetical protein
MRTTTDVDGTLHAPRSTYLEHRVDSLELAGGLALSQRLGGRGGLLLLVERLGLDLCGFGERRWREEKWRSGVE